MRPLDSSRWIRHGGEPKLQSPVWPLARRPRRSFGLSERQREFRTTVPTASPMLMPWLQETLLQRMQAMLRTG